MGLGKDVIMQYAGYVVHALADVASGGWYTGSGSSTPAGRLGGRRQLAHAAGERDTDLWLWRTGAAYARVVHGAAVVSPETCHYHAVGWR